MVERNIKNICANKANENNNIPRFIQDMMCEAQVEHQESDGVDDIIKDYLRTNFNQDGIVIGKITKVQANSVCVDVGLKFEGVIPSSEFRVNGEISVPPVGTAIELWYKNAGVRSNNSVSLSREIAVRSKIWPELVESYKEAKHVVAKILSEDKVAKGMKVDISGVTALLPFSHLDVSPGQGYKSYYGTEKPVVIVNLDASNIESTIIVSRKSFSKEKVSVVGQAFSGTVVDVVDAGANISFEIEPGKTVVGWLPLSQAKKAAQSATEIFNVGDVCQVSIFKVQEFGKIQLTIENVIWEKVKEQFQVDTVWTGKVAKVVDFGVFVILPDADGSFNSGIQGLIHSSDTCGIKGGSALKRFFKEGREIEVKVKKELDNTRRIPLTIRGTSADPWQSLSVKPGDVLDVEVRDTFNNKVFVAITDYIDGLLKFNHYQLWRMPKAGDKIKVTVSECNADESKLSVVYGVQDFAKQQEILKKLTPGYKVDALIHKVVETGQGNYGLYAIYEDCVECFVKRESISKGKRLSDYKEGDMISAVVEQVDTKDNFVTLSVHASEKRTWRESKSDKGASFGDMMGIDNE